FVSESLARCRSKVNQYENQSLIKIENVNQKSDTEFYLGKKCVRSPDSPDLANRCLRVSSAVHRPS
ncbi:MAG: hypothetical protein SGPRY_004956, partial [Prymnesium sp.]